MVSSSYLLVYEALFWSRSNRTEVQESLVRSKVTQDLENTENELVESELKLTTKIEKLKMQASTLHRDGDVSGAKRKLREMLNGRNQLERVGASLAMVSAQLGTIANSELNTSLYSVLKMSNEAISKFTTTQAPDQIEEITLALQEKMQKASDLNDLLSTPMNISTNDFSDAEMDEELDLLLEDRPRPSNVIPQKLHVRRPSMQIPTELQQELVCS
jgi:hypothetical protein